MGFEAAKVELGVAHVKTQRERAEVDAKAFLTELWRGLPEDERLTVSYASEATPEIGEDGRPKNKDFYPVPWKPNADKYINSGKNCYVCISSSIQTLNQNTGKMSYWRGEPSFGHGLALMVDDLGTGTGSKGSVEYYERTLPPTVVVQTSPGNFQLWYFLDRPEPSKAKFKAFLYGFVANVLKRGNKGDTTIKDVARLGRMPCGWNNKRTKQNGPFKYGEPFPVHLQFADYSRRYAIDEIARSFDFDIVIPPERVQTFDRTEYETEAYWLLLAAEEICVAEGGRGKPRLNASGKYRIQCPWGDEHSGGNRDGAYLFGPAARGEFRFVFGCKHDTCSHERRAMDGKRKRSWATFVDQVVMPYIEHRLDMANAEWGAS
ncbi:DNA-primase RepB domain-containing protein [Paraburkholderia saeva]|uniref:DNA-primase RepB domain-containing protein n=1 Tax=Paraburkholderia saeva TaxID=2777537 RepID=UPI001DF69653|nr:DNA-primase RepB domain-containing protein [Paraburkholderia saeva]CAG4916203.1 hypothetical protein R70241_04425 [Paraburkholderia saeva]